MRVRTATATSTTFSFTSTSRDIMCNCGSPELYRMFCGRYDDKYLHHDDDDDSLPHTATSTTTPTSSNSHCCYYEVEGSRHFDLVLRYLAAVHDTKQHPQQQQYEKCEEGEQMTSETSSPTRKRKRKHQDQQQQEKCEEVDVVMDVMCRGGCEVFQAVYRDAQRYELRGLMAHMLTRLMVWIVFLFF